MIHLNKSVLLYLFFFLLINDPAAFSQSRDSVIIEKQRLDSIFFRPLPAGLDIRIPETEHHKLRGRRIWPNNAFEIGEYLIFDIVYGPAKAGTATMRVKDTMNFNGRSCYQIETTATSTPFIDRFFKVRDTVRSYIDVEGVFPWYFEKHIREGRYRDNRRVVFDQINNLATQYRRDRADTLAVPPFVQDVLSSFYYFRTRELEVGSHFDIMNYGDGRMYPLRVFVHRKEIIKVPAGTFDCIVIEPILQGDGLFKHEGRLQIWVTDDENKMPVLMKSKVSVIGSIDCRLRSYSLPRQ